MGILIWNPSCEPKSYLWAIKSCVLTNISQVLAIKFDMHNYY